MADFFLSSVKELSSALLLGIKLVEADLFSIVDNITDFNVGFSFIKHVGNQLETVSLYYFTRIYIYLLYL